MPQMLIQFDDKENKTIEKLSKKWELSKYETIKKIVRDFREAKSVNN